MELLITMADVDDRPDAITVTEFHGWLSETRSVTRDADIRLQAAPGSGAMSGGDLIALATSTVTAITAVIQAYVAWKAARTGAPPLTITVVGGRTTIVKDGSADEIAAAIEAAVESAPGIAAGEQD